MGEGGRLHELAHLKGDLERLKVLDQLIEEALLRQVHRLHWPVECRFCPDEVRAAQLTNVQLLPLLLGELLRAKGVSEGVSEGVGEGVSEGVRRQ